MGDFWFFTGFGVLALPTVLMSCWARARRFAHLPLLILTLTLGGLLCYRYGELEYARLLEPMKYGCGMPDAVFSLALIAISGWVLATGLVLLIPRSTRSVGWRILFRAAPLYFLGCVLGFIVGRYAVWQS
jgi:hypothetical protein